MLRSALPLYARIGFYVATHPWLTAAGYLKVGHSTQVEARLEMASFTTCFTPEWSYYAVVECSTEKEAHVLEQSVLYCLRSRRVPNRELLNVSAHELMPWVHAVAKKLGLRVDVRGSAHEVKALPTTATPPATSFSPTAVVAPSSSSSSSLMNPSPMPVSIVPCTSTKHEMKMDVMEKVQPHINMNGSPPPLRELAIAPYVSQLDELHREMNHHWYAGEKELSPNSIDVEMDLNEVVEVEDQHDFRLKALRPYQEEAVKRLRAELDLTGQAICQMACRCGKTPVAYHMMEHLLTQASGTNQRVLYLVPGLSLLRQTARKLWSYGLAKRKVPLLLIGSDHLPVYLDPDHNELMTTNRDIIRDVVLRHTALVVICTYHSSPLLSALNLFGLTIFDECHRVCGSAEATAFNTMLLLPRHGTRLFLTATPSYDTPIKMHNTSLFGSVAYRYYLREGIDAGFVNPFSVRVVLGEELHFLPPFLHEAMAEVNKMLVFCRDIQHCEEIYEQLQAATLPDSVEPFTVLMAHSRLGPGAVAEVFGRLVSERRCLVLNVRLFQEGVEVPDLNAVFFASPRYSSRDIIQSICRPLNRVDGKPPSTVFLPAVYEAQHRPDHPINLRHFSTLVPFTDALMDEDPNLFEYMIDPAQRRYNFSVVGVRKLRLSSAKLQRFILPAIRRGVRFSANHTDRFHRAARLPWKAAFAELRRIVVECQRYPKTNDMWIIGESPISMYLFYQYARKGYRLHQAGERNYLESHQICDLESLPEWRRYGVHGPYPWTECLRTLEAHLAKHGAAPPLDIHKGGYVGLNATPFERLAGALMHVNQCDAATGVRLSLEKQADLDEMCGRHNICWRKPRDAQGHLLPGASSFITESYNQFKRLVAEAPKRPVMQAYIQLHFPGYPHKHQRMEELRHLEEGKVPPRRQPRRRRRAKKGENKIAEGEEGEEDTQQVVWCRVCRARIDVVQWNQHTSSPEHLQRQREASLTAASSLA